MYFPFERQVVNTLAALLFCLPVRKTLKSIFLHSDNKNANHLVSSSPCFLVNKFERMQGIRAL